MKIDQQFVKYALLEHEYQPLIPGEPAELLVRLESQIELFPRAVRVYGTILQTHLQRHPLLEDWLIIPYFQFFWDSNTKALQWLEDLFDETIRLIGLDAWTGWLKELVKQTDCPTTHALCDRLYDYHLQVFGGLYLAREGWIVEFISSCDDEKKPDIQGVRDGQKCVLECKFVHASEKYESFSRRFNTASFRYSQPRPPLVFVEQCRFPSPLKLKALAPKDCTLVKLFNNNIYKNHESKQIGTFDTGAFIYSFSLPPALAPLDVQYEFAQSQGAGFAEKYLMRLLSAASLQLKKTEYINYQKILFVGLQPDALFLAPWNEPVISQIKSTFNLIARSEDVKVVFSEDADFSVRGYI